MERMHLEPILALIMLHPEELENDCADDVMHLSLNELIIAGKELFLNFYILFIHVWTTILIICNHDIFYFEKKKKKKKTVYVDVVL